MVSGDRADADWAKVVADLRSYGLPEATANADLLEIAGQKWAGLVVPRTSMASLLFTRLDDPFPFPVEVRVRWSQGTFEFRLERGVLLVTADRCRQPNAPAVLDSFLMQVASLPEPG